MAKISTLLERDGKICSLCGLEMKLPKKKRSNHFLRPTRDHIIPLVHGGPNDMENIQLAHAACNSRRGDMPVEEFRKLNYKPTTRSKRKGTINEELTARRVRREAIFEAIRGNAP